MIRVTPAEPPLGFTAKVYKPAKAWAKRKNWAWTAPPPVGKTGKTGKLEPFWTEVLGDLHSAHAGVCAYLSVYIHRVVGSKEIDHYCPKSKFPIALAYDWSNYRLACKSMNTNKGVHLDVLDPFTLPANLFALNLLSGRVSINPAVASHPSTLHSQATATIIRLKLNAGVYRNLRLQYINGYLQACMNTQGTKSKQRIQKARADLLRESPFIHHEVVRQGW